jgi:hypothetical protein
MEDRESTRYSQRALLFALLVSCLQPAISQGTCSPGTAPAPALATLRCGGTCGTSSIHCTPTPINGVGSSGTSSGTISDGSGDFGPGFYLRNLPGSAHQPSSADGALIFVKLWQMAANDTRTVRVDTRDPSSWRTDGRHQVCALYATDHEQVSLIRLPPGHTLQVDTPGGVELLVIEGRSIVGTTVLGALSWLRLPPGDAPEIHAGDAGTTVYLKTGHLAGLAA